MGKVCGCADEAHAGEHRAVTMQIGLDVERRTLEVEVVDMETGAAVRWSYPLKEDGQVHPGGAAALEGMSASALDFLGDAVTAVNDSLNDGTGEA